MPPRKKAADGTASVPTRSSARNKTSVAAVPAPVPAPAAKPKSKGKRARADEDDDDDEAPAQKKLASKKAKKSKVTAGDDEDKDDNAAKDNKPTSNMKQVIVRGAAPVDEKSGKVNTHQVYTNDEDVWDAMLNQTDIKDNKNKHEDSMFCSFCTLFPVLPSASSLLIGEGLGPFSAATAISEFKKQFNAKAGVPWESRHGMEPKKGKYFFIERDYSNDDEKEPNGKEKDKGKSKAESKPVPDSSLKPEVQDFCRLIFNTSYIDATLSSMNYDANKLPLGKLSKATILKGFAALKALSEVIDDPNSEEAKKWGSRKVGCEELTNRYYSIIPHEFGRNRPRIIDNQKILKDELELVDALGEMEIATELINASNISGDDAINPLDAQFNSLALDKMDPIDRDSQEFQVLEQYVKDTHGKTHTWIKANVQNIYRIERGAETDAWNEAGYDSIPDGERMLLWHGSRSTNFAGILSQGLRIAPPEAPQNGYMFGHVFKKGVYFADMMSKSAGYTYHQWVIMSMSRSFDQSIPFFFFASLSGGVGILMLCDVVVKPFYERYDAEYNADESCRRNGKRATKGIGRSAPVGWKDAGKALHNQELDGCLMPEGACEDQNGHQFHLQYNEYIVYQTSQIRVKYLFMIQM
ncbi:hypothetical protein D9757_002114 [Collybiopsis confluens]|uniref:Poly [ADP-ribose] polymerase n=1 Tax=Collybiopsis confluens TaxID=2823264 RepID=A0A8H5I023_9AGAR|nr:hypothetical protein D9757_002114 [Collybiopsis confluens]